MAVLEQVCRVGSGAALDILDLQNITALYHENLLYVSHGVLTMGYIDQNFTTFIYFF